MSKLIRVRVENGRLVGEAPAGLPEGTELEVVLADVNDDVDDLDDGELFALNQVIDASLQQVKAGVGISPEELHQRIRRT